MDCVEKAAGRHFEAAYCVIEYIYSREETIVLLNVHGIDVCVAIAQNISPLLHLNYIKMFLFYVGYIVAK